MSDNLQRFRETHGLRDDVDLREHQVCIDALHEVHDFTSHWLGERDNKTPGDTLLVLAYINLGARLHEHASAMVLCAACRAWPSAEALSRVVLEGSVSLTCLARDGGGVILTQFFSSWLDDHVERLAKWEAFEKARSNGDTIKKIEARRQAVDLWKTFLNHSASLLRTFHRLTLLRMDPGRQTCASGSSEQIWRARTCPHIIG